jgi:sugar transferase (PEP-CTERM/EpsH1 system associated)
VRILYVIPYVPSLVRVRPYHLIRELSARGHSITAATVWAEAGEEQDLEGVRPYCREVWARHLPTWRSAWNCLAALPTDQPLQSAFSWQPSLLGHIRAQIIDRPELFDVIHIEHLRGARYGLGLRQWPARVGRRPALVWDSVDCISLLFRQAAAGSRRRWARWMTRFELSRTERYEAHLLDKFDRVLVTSQADREAFRRLANGHRSAPIEVLPNGVDSPSAAQQVREPNTLVLSGKMSYHANVTMAVHFVERILPLIRAQQPDVRVWIVGKNPAGEVRRLAQDPAVTVTGTVPDVREYLSRAAVAVAPVPYGVGIQNKVLEAMACGTPVVSSPQALQGLRARAGEEVRSADTPEAFAREVIHMLGDSEERRRLGQAGQRYVARNHQWSSIAAQLEDIYDAARSRG